MALYARNVITVICTKEEEQEATVPVSDDYKLNFAELKVPFLSISVASVRMC